MAYIKPDQEKLRKAVGQSPSVQELSGKDKRDYEELKARMCGIR
jgi:hypothetical protein